MAIYDLPSMLYYREERGEGEGLMEH